MATFEFEVIDTSVIDGVRKEVKPKYVWKFPTELETFAKFINAAKANKGKKNLKDEWIFVGMGSLRNQQEALDIRTDVYELNQLKEGKPTLRSRIKEYTQDGKTYYRLMLRYLTDEEQANRDAAKVKKEKNKNAVSETDLNKVLGLLK